MAQVDITSQERDLLIEQKNELMLDIEILKETLRGEVDIDVEEGDPDVVEREKSAAILANLQARLASIDDAIKKIDHGTYGICDMCGQEIPPARLEVKPDATLCVRCQGEVERLQKRGMMPARPRWSEWDRAAFDSEES